MVGLSLLRLLLSLNHRDEEAVILDFLGGSLEQLLASETQSLEHLCLKEERA
jgi:hypothetical protein